DRYDEHVAEHDLRTLHVEQRQLLRDGWRLFDPRVDDGGTVDELARWGHERAHGAIVVGVRRRSHESGKVLLLVVGRERHERLQYEERLARIARQAHQQVRRVHALLADRLRLAGLRVDRL